MKPNPTESDIGRLQDASEWVQRLHESNDQALVDEWMEWCSSDSLNLPAFEQMQSIWEGFSEANAAVFDPQLPVARPTHRNRFIKAAAGVLLLAGAAGWFASRFYQIQAFDTAIGEQRRVTLVDGSQLDLAPDSHVSIRFLARRDVQLERGQAFFAVAHSVLRPFVVQVNGLTVTAVGTAFDVRMGPNTTVVTVSEGRVNVAPGANQVGSGPSIKPDTVRAGVGQQVTYSKPAHRLSVATVDPKIAGSWRDGILQFVGEPLEEVVGEINRYSEQKIVLADAIRQIRFTGTVSTANVGDWLKALEQIYAVEVIDQGGNGFHIRSRDEHGTHK